MASVKTVVTSGNPDVDGVLGLARWSSPNLTYSFGTSAFDFVGDYGRTGEPMANFEALNGAQRAAVRAAYAQISSFANLTFTEVSGAKGTLRFGMTDDTITAHAYMPSGHGKGGDSWFNNGGGRYDAPVAGNYAHASFLHEIGHSLGLKHSHEDVAVPHEHDEMANTVMSYRSYVGDTASKYGNETGGFAQSYMMYDIAALQHLYGANYASNAGNTTYSWNPLTGAMSVDGVAGAPPAANRVFMTLWDGGGDDTYDLTNYSTGVTIDLRPGEWSSTSAVQRANLGAGHYAPGNLANALLVGGDTRSLIENARGGSGDDILIGNGAANVLTGGAGADRLTGGAGADVFLFTRTTDSGAAAPDLVTDFERGQDRIDLRAFGDLAFVGTQAFSGAGGELRTTRDAAVTRLEIDLDGDRAADLRIDLTGDIALTAADFLIGGASGGAPTTPPAPPKAPVADDGANLLTGTAGNDVLEGLGGDDVLIGLGGDDVLNGGSGNDTASYADHAGDIRMKLTTTGAQNSNGAGTDKLISIENLIGGGGANVFTGDAAANRLDGGAGDDQLSGGGGADTLIGGLGRDVLTGGTEADVFLFAHADESRVGARDRIADFKPGQDRIDLSGIDAVAGTAANDAFRFVGTAAFSGVAGQLRYARSGATTLVEGDVNGDRIADFQIELSGPLNLTVNDFIV